jgi:hypothetical protein
VNQLSVYHRVVQEKLEGINRAAFTETLKSTLETGKVGKVVTPRLPFARSTANEQATERRKRQQAGLAAWAVQRFVKQAAPGATGVLYRPPEGAWTGSKHMPLPNGLRGISDSLKRTRRREGTTYKGGREFLEIRSVSSMTNVYSASGEVHLTKNKTIKVPAPGNDYLVATLTLTSPANNNSTIDFKTARLAPQQDYAIPKSDSRGPSSSTARFSKVTNVKSLERMPAMGLAAISKAAGVVPKDKQQV